MTREFGMGSGWGNGRETSQKKTSPAAASFVFKFCFTGPADNQPLRALHGWLGRALGTYVACHIPSRTVIWEQAPTLGSPVALGCQWGLGG